MQHAIYMDGMLLPIAPPSLQITVGSNDKTINLIDGNEINILKSPKLTEISFEARFPMRVYPYAKTAKRFDYYHDKFVSLKENKKPFNFVVIRTSGTGYTSLSWSTQLVVTLDKWTIKEDAKNGDDVLIDFTLKQYKKYGIVYNQKPTSGTTVDPSPNRQTTNEPASTGEGYVVKSGDTLWAIAKKYYGTGEKWKIIYDANKAIIEETARKYGKSSSSNGWWIYPGTRLKIPDSTTVTATSANSSNTSTASGGASNPADAGLVKTDNGWTTNTSVSRNNKFVPIKVNGGTTPKSSTSNITIAIGGTYKGSVAYYATNSSSGNRSETFTVPVDYGGVVRVTIKPKDGHTFSASGSKTWVKESQYDWAIPSVDGDARLNITFSR